MTVCVLIRRVFTVWLTVSVLCVSSWAQDTVIRCIPTGGIYEYRWKLLALALDETREEEGAFQLKLINLNPPQDRVIEMVRNGQAEVTAFSTSPEREATMRPVRIDILRGMLGYRVLLIRQSDQKRLEEMPLSVIRRQLTLGFNSQWADLAILQSNGFRVVAAPNYNSLFAMLAYGRFDAFPRGLNEAWREIDEQHPRYPTLAVETSLAFFTPYPVYFWVRQNNQALADRIKRGLNKALRDGSFQRLFTHYYAAEINHLKRDKRRVLYLHNPLLPPNTPTVDTRWWWSPAS